jgi:hypothetical protein
LRPDPVADSFCSPGLSDFPGKPMPRMPVWVERGRIGRRRVTKVAL